MRVRHETERNAEAGLRREGSVRQSIALGEGGSLQVVARKPRVSERHAACGLVALIAAGAAFFASPFGSRPDVREDIRGAVADACAHAGRAALATADAVRGTGR